MKSYLKIILLSIIVLFNIGCATTYQISREAESIISRLPFIKCTEKVNLMVGTPYETPAFIFDSGAKGENIFIIGGTHGNEPAGYEAALREIELLENNFPRRGKVIVIPLANRKSINSFTRRIPVPEGIDIEKGNLNRCYPGKIYGQPMEQMAFEIEQLARKHNVTIFIDQHEARYFHLNTPKESNRDVGLGQTIIYYPNESSSWIVMNIIDEINSTISNSDEQFSAVEMPIRHSAAWWAGEYLNIGAFTFETTRNMDIERRIKFQMDIVKIILNLSEIW